MAIMPLLMSFMRSPIWLCTSLSVIAPTVNAQDYPSKPVRIVTADAGAGADFTARIVAQGLTASLGQQVLVENRGGNAVIPVEAVLKAPPDGHTLLHYSNAVWTLPLVQSAPYDPLRDLAPITTVASNPTLVVVHPALPVQSIRELVTLAKARPGQLNYSAGGTGSVGHLAAELFKAMAGVDIVRITYKGAGPALNDLIAGQVQVTITSAGSITPHLKSGRLKALAVCSLQVSQLFPGLPTVADTVPGYEFIGTYSLFVPARTPRPLINRLNQEVARILNRDDVKARLLNAGAEPVGNTPEALAAMMKADMVRLSKLIREAGIRVN